MPITDNRTLAIQMQVIHTPIIRPDQPGRVEIVLGQPGYDQDRVPNVYPGVMSVFVPTETALLIEKGDTFTLTVARTEGGA